jgi:hypothetical protein
VAPDQQVFVCIFLGFGDIFCGWKSDFSIANLQKTGSGSRAVAL